MQVPAQVVQLDQVRQAAIGRGLELAPVLTQLGLDVGQAQQGVHLLLGGAAVGLAGGVVQHAVLRDVQTLADGPVAQRHVVLLGAGQVLEQVAELVALDGPQIDPQAGVRAQADP